MPASAKTEAERRLQEGFTNRSLFGPLLLLGIMVLTASEARRWLPDRQLLGPRTVPARFETLALDPGRFTPFRLAGAWRVTVDDPRFGGISALALDGEMLIALSDSGVLVRLPKPGSRKALATLSELPDGPGDPRFKRNRDSEALARDPAGNGWWVAFERHHELWLYDHSFERALRRIRLGEGRWPANGGIEALAAPGGDLLIIPEAGRSILRLRGSQLLTTPLTGGPREISEAVDAPHGGVIVIERSLTARGFFNWLSELEEDEGAYRLVVRRKLPLGRLDNVEAAAAEPLPGGGVRLWLMTDDNQQRPLRTLLIAIDLPRPGR